MHIASISSKKSAVDGEARSITGRTQLSAVMVAHGRKRRDAATAAASEPRNGKGAELVYCCQMAAVATNVKGQAV